MLFKSREIPFIFTIKGLAHVFYEGFQIGHKKRKKKAFNTSPLLQTPLFKCLKLDFVGKKILAHS